MAKHVDTGSCDKCQEIFDKFPGFNQQLRDWFKGLQSKVKDAHVSCAGRGKADQELFFEQGKSLAKYGQSAHNYNLAIDIFRLTQDCKLSYDTDWFRNSIGTAVFKQNCDPNKTFSINWYGSPNAKFRELPHCEVDGWDQIQDKKLVE